MWGASRRSGRGGPRGAIERGASIASWALSLAALGLAGAALVAVLRRPPTPTPSAVHLLDRVQGAGHGERVDVRHLGNGIFELVGRVPDQGTAHEVEALVAETPGVSGVVNRLWIA